MAIVHYTWCVPTLNSNAMQCYIKYILYHVELNINWSNTTNKRLWSVWFKYSLHDNSIIYFIICNNNYYMHNTNWVDREFFVLSQDGYYLKIFWIWLSFGNWDKYYLNFQNRFVENSIKDIHYIRTWKNRNVPTIHIIFNNVVEKNNNWNDFEILSKNIKIEIKRN